MELNKPVPAGRGKERLFLLLVTLIFALLFYRLYTVIQLRFADVDKRLQDGTMVNLNSKDPATQLRRLLEKGYYFDDKRDVDLIEATVANQIGVGQKVDNIGELNKRKYYIDADEAFVKGGKSFKSRVAASRSLLGYTGADSLRFVQEKRNPPALQSVTDLAMGSHSIEGKILNREQQPVAGVLLRLEMILPQDSIINDEPTEDLKTVTKTGNGFTQTFLPDSAGRRRLQSLTAYARTGADGVYKFQNLPEGKAFKVLPLQPGYQFGTSQGVQQLDDDASFTFHQSPHTIRLLSTRDFNILKKEKSLIIRTPQQFNQWYWILSLIHI